MDKCKAKELKKWYNKFGGNQMVKIAKSQGYLQGRMGWVEVQNEARAYYNEPVFSVHRRQKTILSKSWLALGWEN